MISFAEQRFSSEEVFAALHPLVSEWFKEKFGKLSLPQEFAVMEIHNKKNALISAPTGSGKTMSAFLSIISELTMRAEKAALEDRVYCLYISPLKALASDVKKNLLEPLGEIRKLAEGKDVGLNEVRADSRTGDTTPSERQRMLKKPPHILITTPESLAILLSSPKFSLLLKGIQWVIIDEIHDLASNKRGVHLNLSLERLLELQDGKREFVRIGLSATIFPLDEIARYLVGFNSNGSERDCLIVNAQFLRQTKMRVISPVRDLIHSSADEISSSTINEIKRIIDAHRTTLIFTNTRSGTERLVHLLKQKFAGLREHIEAHHSSLSRGERFAVEDKLKKGLLKAVVCSTSLELGIDIGSIDFVVQIGSPKSISRCLQRLGRSGHSINAVSQTELIASNRDDIVEIGVMLSEGRKGNFDKVQIPRNCLDVLCQHLVGMSLNGSIKAQEALTVVRRAFCFNTITDEDFYSVLNYLAGKFGMEEYRVFGRIYYNELDGTISSRGKLARVIYSTNIGTIPDEVSVAVWKLPERSHVGSIEEEFLEKISKGDRFVLGGKVYEFQYAKGMQAFVYLEEEKKPTIPSWFSEMLPLSFELGERISAFRASLFKIIKTIEKEKVLGFIREECLCNEFAAEAIYNYFVEEQKFLELIGISSFEQNNVIAETFVDIDDNSKRHYVFHFVVGRRANEVLSKTLGFLISEKIGKSIGISYNDNGFVITLSTKTPVDMLSVLFEWQKCDLRAIAEKAVKQTEALKRRFRHVATRSFLILRNYLGKQKSVGRQQLSAHILLGVCQRIPNFPLLKETYRELLEDSMDLDNAEKVVTDLKNGKRKLVFARGYDLPSPFAHSLITEGMSDLILIKDKKLLLEQLHAAVTVRIYRSDKTKRELESKKLEVETAKREALAKIIEKRSKKNKISKTKVERTREKIFG